ncbi:unnamed protein product, partial [Iphiclides podalirius]
MIESFQETFNNHSRRLVESLKAECNGAPLDIQYKYLAKTTFRAACGYTSKDCRKSAALFLDVLLELMETDSTLTEERIKHAVTRILLAGHETTASALNFIFLMLGCNLDVQRKLHEDRHESNTNSPRREPRRDLIKYIKGDREALCALKERTTANSTATSTTSASGVES